MKPRLVVFCPACMHLACVDGDCARCATCVMFGDDGKGRDV